jgi:molecular chaperone GrpE (heat shock protein)
MYPHLIQNQEAQPDRMGIPAKPKNEKNEDQNKLKNSPETKTKTAELEDDLIEAPYTMENYPKYLNKYPEHAIKIWVTTFNEVLQKTGDEAKAFPIAWNALKRYMKKQKAEETK